MHKVLKAAALSLMTVVSLSTHAGTISYTATGQGWWAVDNGDGPGKGNHVAGYYIHAGENEYRSYFTFALGDKAKLVTSAVLRVQRSEQTVPLTLGLWDVTLPASVVNAYGRDDDKSIFGDIGSGMSYGTFALEKGSFDDYLNLHLNAKGLHDIRKASGTFSIGASVIEYTTPPGAMPDTTAAIFGYSGNSRASLLLEYKEVPEPSSFSLLGLAVAGLAFNRRRKHVA